MNTYTTEIRNIQDIIISFHNLTSIFSRLKTKSVEQLIFKH